MGKERNWRVMKEWEKIGKKERKEKGQGREWWEIWELQGQKRQSCEG